MIAGSV